MSLIASIGIGAAAYNVMKPNNKMRQAVRDRMSKMAREKELFPDQ
ncbi:hypothetical protein [Sporolactobacillus spathodeae]|uniref:DUF3918 domain-containing protein n=1 Tax=Sporolactobacillus spathodeae TaxID=1465502 RepID=A0ABS2QBD6_9BACL|nr:hypothetical protein [Sporolactobacillus spathodeae]MBM7659122.1 hypothetical protein [Sporolactobacillus spathodeae]